MATNGKGPQIALKPRAPEGVSKGHSGRAAEAVETMYTLLVNNSIQSCPPYTALIAHGFLLFFYFMAGGIKDCPNQSLNFVKIIPVNRRKAGAAIQIQNWA